jgi:peroxiredoxin
MMRNILLVCLAGLLGLALTVIGPEKELEIGSKAPLVDLKMRDVSGQMLSLRDVAGKNGLLVIFSCNTCPWVAAWEDRYLIVAQKAKELGIGMIAVNPNEAYRNRGDGFEDMQKRAQEKGYTFPYVLDEGSKLADAFGATRTPHVFLFNKELVLVYRGAIDDNARNPEAVTQHYLLDAMEAMASGKPIPVATTRSIGCTIKRVES